VHLDDKKEQKEEKQTPAEVRRNGSGPFLVHFEFHLIQIFCSLCYSVSFTARAALLDEGAESNVASESL
jgi:hypothetical protein